MTTIVGPESTASVLVASTDTQQNDYSLEHAITPDRVEVTDDGSVILDPYQLAPLMPVIFELDGHRVMAVRVDGDDVEFYAFPESEDAA